MAKMLMSLGHRVYFYGCKDPSGWIPECTEFIETHTIEDIRADYGDGYDDELGYNWHTVNGYKNDFNDNPKKPSTIKLYNSAITEIKKRMTPDDFLFINMGHYYDPIARAVKLDLKCEFGIGYRGSNKANYRCFESSYMMHFTYGSENPFASMNGSYYDRVIPNYLDPEEFEYGQPVGNYFLFMGRLIKRKGVLTAWKACEAIGEKLIIVGQGGELDKDGNLIASEFTIPKGNWEYLGFADAEKRKGLLSHAIATFLPTEYLEPFGTVHIESMYSGTPVITTNFGVFGDGNTFEDSVHGFKCNTLNDFVQAAIACTGMDWAERIGIHEHAEKFEIDKIKWEYQNWLDDLYRLHLSKTIPGAKGWSYIELP